MEQLIGLLAQEFHVKPEHAQAVVELLDEGNTVPFIARYRKERHGAMDDQAAAPSWRTAWQYLRGLEQRRKGRSPAAIENQGKLTQELRRRHRSAPPPWRRWRTCTGPTGRSGAPAPPWPGRRGWNPWPGCSWRGRTPGGGPLRQSRPGAGRLLCQPGEGGGDARRRPSRGPATSWPRTSPTTPPSASELRQLHLRRKNGVLRLPGWPPRSRRTLSTACTTTSPSPGEAAAKLPGAGHQPGGEGGLPQGGPPARGGESACPASSGMCRPATPTGSCWSRWPRTPGARLLFPSLEREIRGDLTDMADEQAIHTFALNLQPLADAAPGEEPGGAGL